MTQEMTGTRWSDARSLLEQARPDVVADARPQADADPWEATRPLTTVDTSWVDGEERGPAAPPRGLRRRPRLVAASVLECKQVAARAGRHAIADLADLVADRLLETLPGARRLDPARGGETVPAGTVLLLVPRGKRTDARLAAAADAVAAEPLALDGRELRLTPVVGHSSVRDDEHAAATGRALLAMRVAAAAARRTGSAAPVAWTRDLARPASSPTPAAPAATPDRPAAAKPVPPSAPSPLFAQPAAPGAPAAPTARPATSQPVAPVAPPVQAAPAAQAAQAAAPGAPAAATARPATSQPVASQAAASQAAASQEVSVAATPGVARAHEGEQAASTGTVRAVRSALSFGKRSTGRHAVR